MSAPDLARARRIHVVAVGGAAMSAIAHILRRMGHTVSGSDQAGGEVIERLRADGVQVWVGHDAAHVAGADLVAVSTAVRPGNVEYDAAVAAGIPVAGRGDMMEAIARDRRTLAVSGTHGKTTTTAMAVLALRAAGWDPSFVVGGTVAQLGTGVAWTDSPWFVVEADESDGSFLRVGAEAVVVTNVEEDHLDFYGDLPALEAAFDRFVSSAGGPRVLCADDAGAMAVAERTGRDSCATYGTSGRADYRIVDVELGAAGSRFSVEHGGVPLARVELAVPGLHNVRNATSVLAVAHRLGVPVEAAVRGLGEFGGVRRRFERRGEAGGVTFVDDYAHLPTEVAATVRTATSGGWGRVVAVFQPHRYTRTAALADRFGEVFDGADVVVVTGVYAAGQEPIAGVTGRLVADAVRATRPSVPVHYAETRAELVALLRDLLVPGDLCLTMNAGDLTTLPDELLPLVAGGGAARGR